MKREKTAKIISCLINFAEKRNQFLEKFAAPLLLLSARVLMAVTFYKSGIVKFHNMGLAIALFKYEYKIPFLNPELLAYVTTFAELICATLLVLGFAARLSAFVLFVMTMSIHILMHQNQEYYYWFVALFSVVVYGAGTISLDYLIKKICNHFKKSRS